MRRLATAVLAMVLAACSAATLEPAATTAPTVRASLAATSAAPSTAPTAPGSAAATSAARSGFLTYAFTNVRDGSKFTLSDFGGKSVLVIGMAVW